MFSAVSFQLARRELVLMRPFFLLGTAIVISSSIDKTGVLRVKAAK